MLNHWSGFNDLPLPALSPVPVPPPSAVTSKYVEAAAADALAGSDEYDRPAEPFEDGPVAGDDVLVSVGKAGLLGALAGGAVFLAPKLLKIARRLFR